MTMVVLSLEGISKSYGERLLFEGVNFGISRDDRVGLIGVNGSGKSTLLRILMGKETPDDGRVAISRDAYLEYLDQDPELEEEKSAIEVVLSDGPEAFAVVQAYEAACRALANDPMNEKLADRVARHGEEMDRVNGWNLETEAKTILSQLGIQNLDQLVATMSGGQRKRVALARALVRPSDLLILDEPTNHLDVETVAWLEGYLARRTSGLLLITHDRYFLDRVTNVILEIADEKVYRHDGNYSKFIQSREARYEVMRSKEQKRSQLAKKELEWLRRGPKARTTKNKARIQRAEDLLTTSYAVDEKAVEIDTVESRLGRKVVALKDLKKKWDGQPILDGFTYRLDRRDRLGIVGPNGVGKSTLLELIAGRVQPDEGEVDCGETVVLGYYDQEARGLDPAVRVHDYITEVAHRIPTSDGWLTATQMLDLFLFDRLKQWTVIEKLSGGERRRLYLLRILMSQPNVLLLDEPTNDLDIDTLTVLEDYLDDFQGAVIAVSHDRYFLDRTMEHLLYFRGGGRVEEIPGNYSYLEERLDGERREEQARESARKAKAQTAPVVAAPASKKAAKLSYNEKRELEKLEKNLPQLEARQEELDTLMAASSHDYEALAKLSSERESLAAELERMLERWMELSEIAEGS